MNTSELTREKLNMMRPWLPERILEAHFSMRPDMASAYTEHQKKNFKNDVAWILSFLGETLWAGQPALFEEFSAWLRTFLSSVHVPMKDVAESFDLIGSNLHLGLDPEEARAAMELLEKGKAKLLDTDGSLSVPAMQGHLDPLAARYLDFLLKSDRQSGLELILAEARAGMPVRDIYLNVFQPVQYEVGRLWQTSRITVAQEHYCTAATQLVMSQLYPYMFTGERKTKKMIASCVPGELHEMGARMVSDFFEMGGWDTYYLGANMPVEGLIRYIREINPGLLAISATMTYHLSSVEKMIQTVRASVEPAAQPKILVGGYPFKVVKGLWQQIGADGCASNAMDAVELGENLIRA